MGTSSDTVSNGITLSTKGIDRSPLTIAAGGYIKDGGAGTADAVLGPREAAP